MLEIQQLKLRLPQGFEHRAQRISRLVAEQLGDHDIRLNRDIPNLVPAPVTVNPGLSDHQVAARIATAISSAIATNTATGDPL